MSLDQHYPQSCPFCKISTAYPPDSTSAIPSNPDPELVSPQCHLILSTPQVLAFLDIMPISPGHILLTTRSHHEKLSDVPPVQSQVPMAPEPGSGTGAINTAKARPVGLWKQKPNPSPPSQPSSAEPNAAFALEGHTPSHALGHWLPILSRALASALDISDWNVVQNNGMRAAQVVPHVHFHFIPRYRDGQTLPGLASASATTGDGKGRGNVDVGTLKNWRMFGRGVREDLDDDEGAEIARRIREALRREVEGDGSEAAVAVRPELKKAVIARGKL